jgi:hypothetical protein
LKILVIRECMELGLRVGENELVGEDERRIGSEEV